MRSKRIIFSFVAITACLIVISVSNGDNNKSSEAENQEYERELVSIKTMRDSLKPGLVNNLEEYEKFADEIQEKWKTKNPEEFAKIMFEICKPLSSGTFEGRRRFDVAREYALFALKDPNKITLNTELELIGHVMTNTGLPFSPKEQELAKRRKKDVEIRLHAWNRLINAIDPKWDPNEEILSPNAIGIDMGLPDGGIAPESITNPNLRAKYEAALKENQAKIERYTNQNRLHKWMRRYLPQAEKYIVQLYSAPPYNNEELKQLLEKYKIDRKTQTRIINAVDANIQKEAETIERLNKLRGIK